jgi:hypothetical protein
MKVANSIGRRRNCYGCQALLTLLVLLGVLIFRGISVCPKLEDQEDLQLEVDVARRLRLVAIVHIYPILPYPRPSRIPCEIIQLTPILSLQHQPFHIHLSILPNQVHWMHEALNKSEHIDKALEFHKDFPDVPLRESCPHSRLRLILSK